MLLWHCFFLFHNLATIEKYEPETISPTGFLGGNVLFHCKFPVSMKSFIKVTSWVQEFPQYDIYPSLDAGKFFLIKLKFHIDINLNTFIGNGKYQMLPYSGDLLVMNVTLGDLNKTFRCRTHNRLLEQTAISPNHGKIQLVRCMKRICN